MLTTLVKGPVLNKGKNAFSWWYATKVGRHSGKGTGSFIGPVLVLASCFTWAGWFILQARINAAFPAPLTSTSMMFFFATLECAIIGWSLDHHVGAWSLTFPVRLFATLYSGVVASALAYYLMSRCVEWIGPLYVSAFTPHMLVIVGLANWVFLDSKLHLGRNTRPPITRMVLLPAVISLVLGATANQGLYAMSLKYTSPTIPVALTNLLPAMTFILAIAFRMEGPRIHKKSGDGKIVGTLVCVGGAMLTTLVKGTVLNKGKTAFSGWYAIKVGRHYGKGTGSFIGPVLVLASCFAWVGWFILRVFLTNLLFR